MKGDEPYRNTMKILNTMIIMNIMNNMEFHITKILKEIIAIINRVP